MLEVIFSIIILFLAIVGVIELVRFISLSILKVKNDREMTLVVPIYGHDENAEMLLRNAVSCARWLGNSNDSRVVCIDFDMDEETKLVCDIIANEYDFLYVCDPYEFINSMYQEKVL